MKHILFNRVNAFLLVAFLAFTQLTISCHKDDNGDNNNTCTISMKDIAGTYMVTKAELQPPGSTTYTDITGLPPLSDACMKDNTIVLTETGTATYNDAGVVCTPSETGNGTWSLNGQQMSLKLDQSPVDLSTATVESFDCKTLVVTANVDSPIPGSKVRVTLTKQ